MKILFIGSTDSYNQSILSIAKGFKRLGLDVLVLLSEKEDSHNYMLVDDDIQRYYWDKFNNYQEYDVIIYGNILNKYVLENVLATKSLKIGLFFHSVIDEYVLGGANLYADFTLCFGKRFVKNQEKNGVVHNFVPVGIPFQENKIQKMEKIFLFLEQHFYPSGDKGKKQLVDFLLNLANNKKDYKIIIKPRALPTEKKTKHKAKHIYEYFGDIPNNLILLREHYDLQKLVDNAEIIATTFSTAIIPAILQNKKVIFIDGFSMLETYYYNRAMVKRYYDIYKNSGCLMHYMDVLDNFDLICPIKKDFKDNMFFDRKDDFVLSIYNFLQKAIFMKNKNIKDINIEDYQNGFLEATEKSEYQILNNTILEEFYRFNIITGFRLETQRKELINSFEILKNKNISLELYKKEIKEIKNQIFKNSIKYLFENYKQFPIGFKGFYLKYLYDTKNEKECEELPKSWHIADWFYNKYLFTRQKDKKKSKKYLEKYLELANKADYRYTPLYEDEVIEKNKNLFKGL